MENHHRPVTGYPAPNGYSANPPPPSGTAYLYAAAVPPPNYYYPQNPQYNDDSVRRATCLRRIFAFIIGLVVIFGTITFIVWLVLRPQLPQFRVDSFSVSNFTVGNSSLISFTSEIKLTARNPNKKINLAYDSIDAILFYETDWLTRTSVSPFSQESKNETPLTANFVAAGSFMDKEGVDGATRGIGNVEFNLRMIMKVRFQAKAWMTRKRFLRVFCGDLIVGFPNGGGSGALTGEPKQCRVVI